ncbi:MAG: hypothetical protein RMM58_10680 [Chloroflexota bacterium]|nr:hypothetical protein [Dehalococcoidia bacterium]MDW8254330.1 hypothetical protein [Chloroflexota bacterium]
MTSEPCPSYLAEPTDPFFHPATVVGQFRRRPFFCVRCARREGPVLHRDGVLLIIGGRYFAVDFACFEKLELPFRGEVLSEHRARRVLPFVRFRTGAVAASGSTAEEELTTAP